MPTCLAICGTAVAAQFPEETLPEGRRRSVVLYEDVVRPVCEQLGLTFLRADRLAEAGLPADQLLRMLNEVDVVVADLGGTGAEISFGLGARHALGRHTVYVTDGTEPFQGSGTTPCLPFPSASADTVATRQRLMDVLAEMPEGSASHPPTELVCLTRAERETRVEPEAENAPGLFDLAVEVEAQIEASVDDMVDVGAALADLTAMMELMTEDLVRVNHAGASMRVKLDVINRVAKAMDGPAGELEAAAGRYAERMDASLAALWTFMEWAGNTLRSEWPEEAERLLDRVIVAPEELQTVTDSFREVTVAMDLFGTVSYQLRRPVRRITAALHTLFRSITKMEELQSLALKLKGSHS